MLCLRPISPDNQKDILYGPVILTCGCKVHRQCCAVMARADTVCLCDNVQKALAEDCKKGVMPDTGSANMVSTWLTASLVCDLIENTPAAAASHAVSSAPHKIQLPPRQPLVQPKNYSPALKNDHIVAAIKRGVSFRELMEAGITMGELERSGITVDTLVSAMGCSLAEFGPHLDKAAPWAQLLRMGLKYPHLKNRTRLPPADLLKYGRPTPEQFLALFVDKKEMEAAFIPITSTGVQRLKDQSDREALRKLPQRRMLELDYTPKEYKDMGVHITHMMNVFRASEEEMKQLYNRNQTQAISVWGNLPIAKKQVL